MRDAAVGFHCPECVKEGARSTRQAKGTYGGSRLHVPGQATFTLIGINALVWLAVQLTGGGTGTLLDKLALLPRSTSFRFPDGTVQTVQGVSGGAYWQLVTVMFTHVAVLHIVLNMVSLYFLGPLLEQALGRARFLAVYLLSGLIASATIMWFSSPSSSTVGASGAIFGLMGALLVLVVKKGLDARQILFWVALNLAFTFFSGFNISWQGHVGGLVGGMLVTALIVYAPRKNREPIQWVGVGVITVLAIVAAVVRATALG